MWIVIFRLLHARKKIPHTICLLLQELLRDAGLRGLQRAERRALPGLRGPQLGAQTPHCMPDTAKAGAPGFTYRLKRAFPQVRNCSSPPHRRHSSAAWSRAARRRIQPTALGGPCTNLRPETYPSSSDPRPLLRDRISPPPPGNT